MSSRQSDSMFTPRQPDSMFTPISRRCGTKRQEKFTPKISLLQAYKMLQVQSGLQLRLGLYVYNGIVYCQKALLQMNNVIKFEVVLSGNTYHDVVAYLPYL